jgi:hypothetical protein
VAGQATSSLAQPASWPHQLLIAIPGAELGYTQFWQGLALVEGYGWHLWKKRVLIHSGGYIHNAHNTMAKEALKIPGWRRLLFLEHDHGFPPDVLYRHAQYTQPIVAGTYVLRDLNSPLPVFYNWDAGRHNALHPNAADVKYMLDNPGLHEVDVVPMGCTSIRRDVLESWQDDQPMFNSFTNPRGATMSDDVWFCRIAQDAGWTIYVDTSLKVNHLVLTPIDDRYFVRWWNDVGSKPRRT